LYGRRIHIALLGLLLALGVAAPAQAAYVNVTSAGSISGSAVVGQRLTVSNGTWTGPSGTSLGRQWLRCSTSSTTDCDWISNATSTQYTLTTSDKGNWIRLALYAYYGNDWDYAISNATAVIAAAPTPTPTPTPTPAKTPTPTPTPTRTPTPTPTPAKTTAPVISPTPTPVATPTDSFNSTDAPPAGGQPSGDPIAAPVAQPSPAATHKTQKAAAKKKAKPKMIKPYPTVRISGRVTKTGADVALLTVRAPRGVRITLTCEGSGCPLREVAQATSLFHIQQFERELRAGTKLTITVTKPNHITKVTTIMIRKGKGPARSDKCERPGETKLIACPKG
jgi:hypothetical protein